MSMNNGTILIIEDDADIREAVRILLGNEKYVGVAGQPSRLRRGRKRILPKPLPV